MRSDGRVPTLESSLREGAYGQGSSQLIAHPVRQSVCQRNAVGKEKREEGGRKGSVCPAGRHGRRCQSFGLPGRPARTVAGRESERAERARELRLGLPSTYLLKQTPCSLTDSHTDGQCCCRYTSIHHLLVEAKR